MKTKIKAKKIPANFWKNPIHFVAMGFGSGLLPLMPGTWGTLVAIPIYLLLHSLPTLYYILVVVAVTILGFWLCGITAHDLGEQDPPSANFDEIVGYLATMIAIPFNWAWIIVGFILFRIFDIWKPWPISWVNRNIHGGLGIIVDDLLAALPSWVILQFIIWGCG